jgi:hypothetical protein
MEMANIDIPDEDGKGDPAGDAGEGHIWRSCCFLMQKEGCLFAARVAVSLLIGGFSAWRLVVEQSCEQQGLYGGMIGGVITYWLK